MSQQTARLAILFADICGSTALYERLGDAIARQLIARCIALLSDKVVAHEGIVIKTIGDEIMCTFPSAESAVRAACAMHTALENSETDQTYPMHVRIGLHYGEVIREAGDVFGDTVNVAARVASITRANQIMTTASVINLLPADLREKSRQILRAELKGKQEQLDIFQVSWEDDDMQRTRIGTPESRALQGMAQQLVLRYRDQSVIVNDQRKSILLGRDASCDISMQNTFASRQHARIELRFGKFIVSDQSTNGTYIRFSDGPVVRLTREDTMLRDSGSISLGQPYSDNPTDVVEFLVQSVAAK